MQLYRLSNTWSTLSTLIYHKPYSTALQKHLNNTYVLLDELQCQIQGALIYFRKGTDQGVESDDFFYTRKFSTLYFGENTQYFYHTSVIRN